MLVTLVGILILVRATHPLKSPDFIICSPVPKVTFSSDMQPEKASLPRSVMLFGITISFNEVQLEKVPSLTFISPTVVTPFPIVISTKLEHPSKTFPPSVFTLLGTLIVCKLVQLRKQEEPIVTTLSPMLTLDKLEQLWNAEYIAWTLFGMVTLVRLRQFLNA